MMFRRLLTTASDAHLPKAYDRSLRWMHLVQGSAVLVGLGAVGATEFLDTKTPEGLQRRKNLMFGKHDYIRFLNVHARTTYNSNVFC